MPLAFSIFSSKRASGLLSKAAPTQPVPESPVEEAPAAPASTELPSTPQDAFKSPFLSLNEAPQGKSPFPVAEAKDERTQLLAPPASLYNTHAEPVSWLPMKREGSGLVAMVVNQSSTEAPPLNRKPQPKTFPGLNPFPQENKEAPADFLPPASPFMAASESPAAKSGLEEVREALQEEINQVRNDLFGAVMGVSALKDRLDDLETTTTQNLPAPAPSIDRAEIESWISAWLETHLPAALDRALSRLEDKTHGTMSTTTWFRQPVHIPSADRHTFLSQPPVVIASTPV